MKLEECKTVEEVEELACKNCARTGHWGWCDAPWIKCSYRDKIKQILGKTEYNITNISDHLDNILNVKNQGV